MTFSRSFTTDKILIWTFKMHTEGTCFQQTPCMKHESRGCLSNTCLTVMWLSMMLSRRSKSYVTSCLHHATVIICRHLFICLITLIFKPGLSLSFESLVSWTLHAHQTCYFVAELYQQKTIFLHIASSASQAYLAVAVCSPLLTGI